MAQDISKRSYGVPLIIVGGIFVSLWAVNYWFLQRMEANKEQTVEEKDIRSSSIFLQEKSRSGIPDIDPKDDSLAPVAWRFGSLNALPGTQPTNEGSDSQIFYESPLNGVILPQ